MEHYIEEFKVYCLVDRGLSQNTVKYYLHDISLLQKFLQATSVKSWSTTTYDDIRRFISQRGKGLSDTSLFRSVIALRVFFKFLRLEGLISKSSLVVIDLPKVWSIIPDILSIKEMQVILDAPDTSNIIGARDKAFMELMYSSGLRVSEICNLQVYDIHKDSVEIIEGKGKKNRSVPIGKQALKSIDIYLARRLASCTNILFVSRKGNKMSRSCVWRRIHFYSKMVGIKKTISPHSFRRSFATHLYENGVDISIIRDMLGHESINTTDRYARIIDEQDFKNASISQTPNMHFSKEFIWSWLNY